MLVTDFGDELDVKGSDVVTIYNSEVADKDIRGKLSITPALMKYLGESLVLIVSPFVSYKDLGLVCVCIPIIFFFTFIFMPETPYFLVRQEYEYETVEVIKRLNTKTTTDLEIDEKFRIVQDYVKADRNKIIISYWEFITKIEYRKALLIMAGVKTFQIWSGSIAIHYYLQTIVESSGSGIAPRTASIVFGFIQVPTVIGCSFLVDRVGRKCLLIISTLVCGLACFGEGLYFFLQDYIKTDVAYLSWLPVTGLIIYLIGAPMGLDSVPYTLLGEYFPADAKGKAVSLSVFYGATSNIIVAQIFKPSTEAFGIYTVFWFFSIICISGSIFTACFLIETKGKTFMEIQNAINGNKPEGN